MTCSVADAAGASDSDGFDVTVVDTTPPVLAMMPTDRSVTTTDAAGAVVTFIDPTAADVVDADPSVACAPVSGSAFPIGTTPVTCTATDANGNASVGSFDVTVDLVAPAPGPARAPAGWSRSPGRAAHSTRTAAGRSRSRCGSSSMVGSDAPGMPG